MAVINAGGDPILYSGLETANLRIAFMIEREVREQLADISSIRQFIPFYGDLAGQGTDAITTRMWDGGAKTPFASVADGADVTSSGSNSLTSTITLGRSALRYDISDLASFSGMGGGMDLDPFAIGAAMARAAEARMQSILCATFSSVTASVGTTTVDLTVSNWLDAMYTLEIANNEGPYLCVLAPRQFADLQAALRTENNNFLAYMPASAEMSKAKGQGYQGDLLGVSIFRSDYCATANAGADRVGCMFNPKAFGYAIGTPAPMVGAGAEIRNGPVQIEFQRDASKGLVEIVGSLYMGASLVEDARACKIVTDA